MKFNKKQFNEDVDSILVKTIEVVLFIFLIISIIAAASFIAYFIIYNFGCPHFDDVQKCYEFQPILSGFWMPLLIIWIIILVCYLYIRWFK